MDQPIKCPSPLLHLHTHTHTLQVISNACATQAILSVLLNAPDMINLGEELKNFRKFTAELPPDLKGKQSRCARASG